jgi:hypothetical protein
VLRSSVFIFVLALLFTPLTLGTDEFPDYPLRTPSEFAIHSLKGDVLIGIEPVETTVDQKTYFHADIVHLGFLPVFVVIHNGSPETSYLLDKSAVEYGATDSSPSTPKSGSKAGQALGLSAIPFVGLFQAMKVVRAASQIQQNILQKELQSTTLSPGAFTHGFLYIPIRKGAPREKIRLMIPVLRPGTDEQTVLEFVF